MTNNDIDVDVDADGDLDKDLGGKASLKEAWDSNPLLKIAAVVLVGAVVVGGYMTFLGGEEEVKNASSISGVRTEEVRRDPTQAAPDEVYKQAVEEVNVKGAQQAAGTGGSFIPSSTGGMEQGALSVAVEENKKEEDPLIEWRTRSEMTRRQIESKIAEEEEAPAPDVVPMVAPVRPQQQQVRPQDQKLAQALAAQMRTIVAAQAPGKASVKEITRIPSAYTSMKEEERKLAEEMEKASAETAKGGGATAAAQKAASKKTILPAGAIVYAQLMNELNSDVKSPALVQILSGPFAGGRAIGEFKVQQEYMTLSFNKIIKDGVVYNMNGIALNEETTLAAHASDVDYHYFSRVVLPAAAKFIEGYASAVAETGTTTTTTAGGGVATETPEPSEKEELLKGVEEASSKLSDLMTEQEDRPITVHVNRGITMGILLMDSITTGSIQQ